MRNDLLSSRKKGLNVYRNFLHEYFRNIHEIGSVWPDSAVCVQTLLRHVPFASAGVLLEFGSASGAVTRELVRRKKRETLLICFEKNRAFHRRLLNELSGENVFILNFDVFDCVDVLRERFGLRCGDVDCIVSTLPCSSLNIDRLLEGVVLPLLAKGGAFVQYMHTLSALKGFRLDPVLWRRFSNVTRDIDFRNLPPALVYACTK